MLVVTPTLAPRPVDSTLDWGPSPGAMVSLASILQLTHVHRSLVLLVSQARPFPFHSADRFHYSPHATYCETIVLHAQATFHFLVGAKNGQAFIDWSTRWNWWVCIHWVCYISWKKDTSTGFRYQSLGLFSCWFENPQICRWPKLEGLGLCTVSNCIYVCHCVSTPSLCWPKEWMLRYGKVMAKTLYHQVVIVCILVCLPFTGSSVLFPMCHCICCVCIVFFVCLFFLSWFMLSKKVLNFGNLFWTLP